MEMIAVDSSQLESVGQDPETGKGMVRFLGKGGRPGSLYEYDDTTPEEAKAIIDADSPGRQFAATWKYGKTYRKIE